MKLFNYMPKVKFAILRVLALVLLTITASAENTKNKQMPQAAIYSPQEELKELANSRERIYLPKGTKVESDITHGADP